MQGQSNQVKLVRPVRNPGLFLGTTATAANKSLIIHTSIPDFLLSPHILCPKIVKDTKTGSNGHRTYYHYGGEV